MISVIIPTFNRADMIGRSLESVLGQTFTDLEILIVDGSNNDDTWKLLSTFSDKRIKYLKTHNKSAAHSRNIGIKNAKGDFVAFNDDDDIWCNSKIEKQLGLFKNKRSNIVVYSIFSKVIGRRTRKTPDRTVLQKCGNIYNEVLQRNFIGLPTVMLPLSCCQKVLFDENLQCLEDWEWIIRLAKEYNFDLVEETLVNVGDTHKSVNKSKYNIKAASYKKIYDKHYLDIKKVPRREAKHMLSIGSNLCLSGDLENGRRYLMRAMKLNSKSPKIIGCYLLSYTGTKAYCMGFGIFEKLTHRQP